MSGWRRIADFLALRRQTALLLVALVLAGLGQKLWLGFAPKYLETLGAQAVVDLRKEQAALAREATGTATELYNVGLADRPDQMKAEIAQQRAEAQYFEALNKYEEAWRKLAATTGFVPGLLPNRFPSTNRPTFQQVLEFDKNGP